MVKQRLISNLDNILKAKIYFFMQKSIWKYLLASVLLGFSMPFGSYSSLISIPIYFALIMIIVMPALYLSAKTQAKTSNFDAMVEFKENEIIIHHTEKEVESTDWNWIKKIEIRRDTIWLIINQVKPYGISLPKSKLTDTEINFFESIKKLKYDQ